MQRYNVVVIGGGSAGLMVAAGAAGIGAKVALVEGRQMGGDCLNYGCIPSKALIHSARQVKNNHLASGRPGTVDTKQVWPRVAAHVQGAIDTIAPHDSVERFQSLGVDVVLGKGRLLGKGGVEVTGPEGNVSRLESRAIVIATGSSPAVPPVPGLEEAGFITNEEVFSLEELPKRMLVMGGGPIGCELGQSMARLGVHVILAEFLPTLLPREDPEVSALVAESLSADGAQIYTGHKVTRVEVKGKAKKVFLSPVHGDVAQKEKSFEVDEILVATGRSVNVEGLGLEDAGVKFNRTGIKVDTRLRTSAKNIYACGDVAGPYLFTHTANQQARVVIQNALLPVKSRMDYRVIPWCTYTDPEVARVGLNEMEAKAKGIAVRKITIPFSEIDRAVCEDDTVGHLSILTPPGRSDILGATMVGAHAGEMIHEVVLAMHARIGLDKLAQMIHIYPTRTEIFRRAADASRKEGFTPIMQRLLSGYLRWRR